MISYLFPIVLLILIIPFEFSDKKHIANRFLLPVIYIYIALLYGLRWETGTDWTPYYEHFNSDWLENTSNFEYGYDLIVKTIKIFSLNYSFFLLLLSSATFLILYRAVITLSVMPALATFFIYTSTVGYMGSNRQLLAVSIVTLSINALLIKNYRKYFVTSLVASFFHGSSIFICALYYISSKLTYVKSVLVWVFVASVMLSIFKFWHNISLEMFGLDFLLFKIEYYLSPENHPESGFGILGLARRLLILAIFIKYRRELTAHFIEYRLFFNIYVGFCVFYFVFQTTMPIFISRGGLYLLPIESFLLAMFVFLKGRSCKIVAIFLCVLYGLLMFYQSITAHYDLFDPYYSTIWNNDTGRELY